MYLKVMMPKRFQFRMVPSFKNFLLDRKGDIHYIGGADVLPAPLEPAEEAEVIADLGTEYDTKAKTMLIEHNLRLVVYIAKKFDNTGVGVEDLISIGTIGLIKAINSFDINKKIKLATGCYRILYDVTGAPGVGWGFFGVRWEIFYLFAVFSPFG